MLFENYIKLVYMKLLHWTRADLRRKDALIERFELDCQSFQPVLEVHSSSLSIIIPDRNLTDRPAESEDRRALGPPSRQAMLSKRVRLSARQSSFIFCPVISILMCYSRRRVPYRPSQFRRPRRHRAIFPPNIRVE